MIFGLYTFDLFVTKCRTHIPMIHIPIPLWLINYKHSKDFQSTLIKNSLNLRVQGHSCMM